MAVPVSPAVSPPSKRNVYSAAPNSGGSGYERISVADVARLLRTPENATSTPLLRILDLHEILWRLRKNFVADVTRLLRKTQRPLRFSESWRFRLLRRNDGDENDGENDGDSHPRNDGGMTGGMTGTVIRKMTVPVSGSPSLPER